MGNNRQTVFEVLGRHPIHPFPARMAPGIALNALTTGEKPLRILDPMMGSGTVLAMARANGHQAVGIDIDPLAVLLAKVWTTAADEREIIDAGQHTLSRAKSLISQISPGTAYPQNANAETRDFLRYWFDPNARQQLTALAIVIARIRRHAIRDALWCAFSRLIISKSSGASLAMDLSHSRPHKAFDKAPIKPFDGFDSAVVVIAKNCVSSAAPKRGPKTKTILGDARKLPAELGSFDLVLTSPPYLNAIDYIRCSKFSLVWMGYNVDELRDTRATSVGSEASLEEASDSEVVKSIIEELGIESKLKRLFAIAISIGVGATLIKAKWIEQVRLPDVGEFDQILIVLLALFATVLSWDGYLSSVRDKPLIDATRFAIDVTLVFTYMFLIVTSGQPVFWLPILCWMFLLYLCWDVCTVRQFPEHYDYTAQAARQSSVRTIAKVYFLGFVDGESINRGPIITACWAIYFAFLLWLAARYPHFQMKPALLFAFVGLILYRTDKRSHNQSGVRGLKSALRCFLIVLFGLAAFLAAHFSESVAAALAHCLG